MEMHVSSASTGIYASMANAVTPGAANELTFRFTSTYLAVIIAVRSFIPVQEECELGATRWTLKLLKGLMSWSNLAKTGAGF